MRESIGTVSLLNFIIFFIFLVFAFLMATFSYYKAYRVNNAIVAAIEKYEGFNQYSAAEIDSKLYNLGYERVEFNCPATKGGAVLMETPEGSEETYQGYCIYVYNNDTIYTDVNGNLATTDQYDSYEVVTVITFRFPVVQDLLRLRVSARTDRIYNFNASWNAIEGASS